MSQPTILDGDADILLLCDHASNVVPEGITLGIAPDLLDLHIAVDIGAEPLTRALAERLDAPAILATVSRLVIDLHREPDHPALIPTASDGHAIPGNRAADRDERIDRFHRPYHEALARLIDARAPRLLASIHSFTPQLEQGGAPRHWEAGILYNADDRAARVAIDLLRARRLEIGDNEPYSGKLLNATLNRHGEARGLPYLAIEVRNDLISDAAGVWRWTQILSEIIAETRNRVA
ncbi:N-formylglutamate amidohydrolase [Hephaestia sp. GCM10023244]|uniref:N-formylglutamate amidohydrolase n=1 Tax=unclassified Hephaestia TaxID=2631281 RepID=UPI00207743C0|nr:N-formylglutamate amidohydrolase [Hephaestia sp. MAHUQ-44]MCM8731350.1 N-formylglutamate amidohydrolase [Hephaestia sp. MAHUQ-44]